MFFFNISKNIFIKLIFMNKQTKQQKLAQNLRDNLKRRKALTQKSDEHEDNQQNFPRVEHTHEQEN
ncbi:hypothetical protein EF513_04705 [Rickettsiales endosymbiont of Stachyamoeba lipophora]|nr:hypothetical protein EF513_04705 [Rickettsiales endosymbiont of Stachyamoeba lipophora]